MESIVMDYADPHAMRILLNGDARDIQPDTTVKSLLDSLGLDSRVVAVEVNRSVVKRDRYTTTQIPEGAEVEVVAFVGGGQARRRHPPSRFRAMAGKPVVK